MPRLPFPRGNQLILPDQGGIIMADYRIGLAALAFVAAGFFPFSSIHLPMAL